jgi:hypothetical protein
MDKLRTCDPVVFGRHRLTLAEKRYCWVACMKICYMRKKNYNVMIMIFILCKYTPKVLILSNYVLNIFKTY